jgi:uncharacterized membrane protein YedE/YeeE
MTFPLSPELASQTVVWGGLLIGLALGAVAQGTRFCTMGALADWFAYGGTARLMMWVLAAAVAATGTLALIELQLLDASQTIAWSKRFLWLSYIVGGTLFGFGMVLGSGCPQRNLVKAGSGSLKALVTLLVAGVVAQMTLRGVLSELRVGLLDSAGITLPFSQDLGSLLAALTGTAARAMRWLVLAALLLVAAKLLWKNRSSLEAPHWLGGMAVGLLVPAAWLLTGYMGYLPEHPETLEPGWLGTYSHRPEALTFAAPVAHSLDLLTLWSDRNNTASYGVMVCLGTLLGSAALALARKEFRWESFQNSRDMGNHLVGGVLMGFGGVTAMGCSIGQGVTGLSLQSAGACLAVGGIVLGTWLALRFQVWQFESDERKSR